MRIPVETVIIESCPSPTTRDTMNYFTFLAALALALQLGQAKAACEPIRIGYPDQHRPPYWLGAGTDIPERPGAAAELVRQFAASAGCGAILKRLPSLRIAPALASGEIDFAPMDSSAPDTAHIVFPRDRNNQLDASHAIPLYIVVYVRSEDKIARAAEPLRYFQGRLVGITLGSGYRHRMQQAGIRVDSGAVDIARNLEKLKLQRIDGFAVAVTAPGDMDAYIAEQYQGRFARMAQPLFSDHLWLAASENYYNKHRAQVDTMWNWLGVSGRKAISALLERYSSARRPAAAPQ